MKFWMFIFFYSLNLYAQGTLEEGPVFENTVIDITEQVERNRAEPMLSDRYRQGSFFIYDCDDHHFACVNFENYQECKNRREERAEARQVNLSCAPMKEFESFEACKSYQISVISRLVNKEFCFQDTGETLLVF